MQILSTKLFIPPLRSKLITRSRLIQKLNQGLECGFVLVSAPAGYGKSTLISTWLTQTRSPIVWYSLDEGDNDPARFLTYIAAGLGKIEPSLDETLTTSLRSSPLHDAELMLTPIVNQLAETQEPFWLVLDDFHHIQNEDVHRLVRFLLERRPAALHLVISTRADPPLPLGRLRVRSEMVELRQADLRFTVEEASDFFHDTMGLKISSEDTARITARTEGWIAGMQIAALSMQNTEDISGFIAAFTGREHHIFDYLLEEILARQSLEIRRFLISTSILDQLTAPLCDALLSENDDSSPIRPSSVILDELEHANLFIIPLDPERRWYRYHPLFADLLRDYLLQNFGGQSAVLHGRASAWFEGQGWVAEAVHHALDAGDWERVLRLLSTNVFALLEQSELLTVARKLESVTGEKSAARPWLWIGRAWLAGYTGQLSSVDQFLSSAESEMDSLDGDVDRQMLGGHIAAARAFAAWQNGQQDIAAQAAQEALECLPAADYLMRCQSATLLGLSRDDMDERAQAFKQALMYAREIPVSHVTIFAHGCWAYLLSLQGKLREAQNACRDAIRLAQSSSIRQPLPTLSHIYSTFSLLCSEWNDLEASVHYAREAVALAQRWEQADALHFAFTNLGSALFAAGDVEGAFDVLHQAWQVAYRTSTWFQRITITQEVEWYLALDNLDAAAQRLRLAQIDIEDAAKTYPGSLIMLSIAQIFLRQKQYAKALMALSSVIEDMENRKISYPLVRALTWQALTYHQMGQETQALASLQKALALAAPEGYVRSFLRAGKGLIPLLIRAREAGIFPAYVEKLLASIEPAGKPQPVEPDKGSPLVEPLSQREVDVLNLLSLGCSDKKIAETLVIARETVHKHLKNIYGKLDVHSRTEAVARARQLGLL